jgi:hypothetical protein
MVYEAIDPVIDAWANTNGLHIQKVYKEIVVRSIEYRISRQEGYQIWIDEPYPNGLIGVHVWDFKRVDRGGRRRDFLVSSTDLREYLDTALSIASTWLEKAT